MPTAELSDRRNEKGSSADAIKIGVIKKEAVRINKEPAIGNEEKRIKRIVKFKATGSMSWT